MSEQDKITPPPPITRPMGYFWAPVILFPGSRPAGRGVFQQVIAYEHDPHAGSKYCILGIRVCLN